MAIVVPLSLIALLITGGVVVFAASAESPLESATAPEPLIAVAERADRSGDTSVSLSTERADALSPVTQAQGTITDLPMTAGDEVTNGQVIIEIDARQVIAYTSDTPLFRDVAAGARGRDVTAIQRLLADLGLLDGEIDGRAGPATQRAITAFNRDHGYGAGNPVLSRAALVWLGPGPVTVDTMAVQLGEEVSPGTELFTTTSGIAAITVEETPAVPRNVPLHVVVGGVTVPYEAGWGRIADPDDVAAIAGELGPSGEGTGVVRLVTSVAVAMVPSSAVVADEEGRTCIFADATSGPIAVVPLGGSLGSVDLDVSFAGSSVLVNPRDVRQNLSCG